MNWDKITPELEKKLDPANVSPPKQFGPKGYYIESWHAIAEANRIFGFNGWSARNVRLECVMSTERKIGRDKKDGWGVTYVCTREIVVDGVTRQGSGAGHGYDIDLGMAHESAIKEAESDAEKRALRTFGNPFGLALYDKSQANVGVDVDHAAVAERVTKRIVAAKSLPQLQEVFTAEWPNIKALPDDMQATVTKSKDDRKAALTGPDPAKQAPQDHTPGAFENV